MPDSQQRAAEVRRDHGTGSSTSDREIPASECHELAPRRSATCVLIPVLNENGRILAQLDRVRAVEGMPDIIITDGGSTDGSMDLPGLRDRGVRTLLIKRDRGRVGAQLRIGFAYALSQGYDGVITIDGNGKDDVAAIPAFVEALGAGYDFVQASRFIAGGEAVNTPFLRWLGIRLIHAPALSIAGGFRYTDTTSGFRAHSRRLLESPAVQPFRDVFQNYELLWYFNARAPRTGHRVRELPVRRAYPASGPTPTKMNAAAEMSILRELLQVVLGRFNP